jgi:DNA-binding transcriptional ArsR family regulator
MNESTYIMANLNDEQAEALGKIIANKTSRKILNLLAKKPLTESDIARELKLPISTIDYNIKQLLKAKLIQTKDYFWSEKGNKMPIYSLSKKLVLIAPEGTNVVRSRIKNLFPVLLITFGISVAIRLIYPRANLNFQNYLASKSADVLTTGVETGADIAVGATRNIPLLSTLVQESTKYAAFFFGGALLTILLYLFFTRNKASN